MHMARVGLTRYRSSQQLLQVVPEKQLVARDLEAGTKEEGATDALKHLIRQSVLVGCSPLGSHHLYTYQTLSCHKKQQAHACTHMHCLPYKANKQPRTAADRYRV